MNTNQSNPPLATRPQLQVVSENSIREFTDASINRLMSIWGRLNTLSNKIHGDMVPNYGAPAVPDRPTSALTTASVSPEPTPISHAVNQIVARLDDIEDALTHLETGL